MKTTKFFPFSISILIISWVVAFLYEPTLPGQIAIHWNIKGEADGYIDKSIGIYMMPMTSTVIYMLFLVLPKISPRGFRLDNVKNVLGILLLTILSLDFIIMVMMFEATLSPEFNITQWTYFLVGVLFVVLGNYMGKLPKNFFIGIRTPWTLVSDEVWFKTHKLGGRIFFATGLLTSLGSLLNWPHIAMVTLLCMAALIPLVHSFVIYKKIEGL